MQQAATCQRLCHAACQGKTASSPPKPCHHQSQRYTRSVMPLAKKQQAPRQPNEVTQSKEVGPEPLSQMPPSQWQPNPLACRRAARPEYRPCCLKATAARTKNHPPWDGLKICQFAFLRQGPFASAEYLVQLTSSLAQKVCLGTGKPLSPRGMAEKPSTQPAGKEASS